MSDVKTEATGASVTIEFDGETYTLPPIMEWDLDVLEAMEDGNIVTAVRTMLGTDGWARFKAKRRTVADLNAFFERAAGAVGLGN